MEDFNFEHLFTLNDQKRFAKLSGDYNPIHISEKISRKLITGECIVHGINLFLVGLENLTLLGIDRYYSFEIKFINPLYLNRKVNYKFEKNNSTLLVLDKNKLYMKAKINFSEIPNKSFSKINLKTIDMIKTPQNVLQKNLYKNKEIRLTLVAIFMCETLFQNLSRLIGAGLISQIASLSEIIGMKVLGRILYSAKRK